MFLRQSHFRSESTTTSDTATSSQDLLSSTSSSAHGSRLSSHKQLQFSFRRILIATLTLRLHTTSPVASSACSIVSLLRSLLIGLYYIVAFTTLMMLILYLNQVGTHMVRADTVKIGISSHDKTELDLTEENLISYQPYEQHMRTKRSANVSSKNPSLAATNSNHVTTATKTTTKSEQAKTSHATRTNQRIFRSQKSTTTRQGRQPDLDLSGSSLKPKTLALDYSSQQQQQQQQPKRSQQTAMTTSRHSVATNKNQVSTTPSPLSSKSAASQLPELTERQASIYSVNNRGSPVNGGAATRQQQSTANESQWIPILGRQESRTNQAVDNSAAYYPQQHKPPHHSIMPAAIADFAEAANKLEQNTRHNNKPRQDPRYPRESLHQMGSHNQPMHHNNYHYYDDDNQYRYFNYQPHDRRWRRPRLNMGFGLRPANKLYKKVLLCDKTLVSLDYIRNLELEPRPFAGADSGHISIHPGDYLHDNSIDIDPSLEQYLDLDRRASNSNTNLTSPTTTTTTTATGTTNNIIESNNHILESRISNDIIIDHTSELKRSYLTDEDPLVKCDMWDLEKGLKNRKPPKEILQMAVKVDFDTVRDAINRCRHLSEKTLPADDEYRDGIEIMSTEDLVSLFSVKRGLIPGTKWCGLGDQASSYNDLGPKHRIDICCRAHDHCPIRLKPFRNDYGVLNIALYTKSHCDCDADFYRCLREVRSRTADMLGNLYFNVMKLQCMREERMKICREMKSSNEEAIGGLSTPPQGAAGKADLNIDTQSGELEAAGSAVNSVVISTSSHRIVADGWPSTSSMWPSTDTLETQQGSVNSSSWFNLMEPFIYADKPRSIDYSLLLALNSTVLNALKTRIKPMSVNLSFEYYFNHDPLITALPGIKIEVDRKQFKYLEPLGQLKPRVWMKFNEQIWITDPQQFDNHDWLKFSLVNRQHPSLVAIRHLKVEFTMTEARPTNNPPTPETPPPPPAQDSQAQVVITDSPIKPPVNPVLPPIIPPAAASPPPTVPPSPSLPEPARPLSPPSTIPAGPAQPPQLADTTELDVNPNQPQNYPPEQELPPSPPGDVVPPREQVPYDQNQLSDQQADQQPAASNTVTSKPVKPDKKGWGWGKKRRKRQTSVDSLVTTEQKNIVLTCFSSDQCDWKADASEAIQWSLARMPPSTNTVHSGYYYVSNQNNYGDSSKMLSISLNQTDSATIADQNSDHCVELALYATERTYLKLYRLTKSNENPDSWVKGNLLLTWAPTMASQSTVNGDRSSAIAGRWRSSLPNSRLSSMTNGQSGWTLETLCYGDFFVNTQDCGHGKCAFGFEMEQQSKQEHQSSDSTSMLQERNSEDQSSDSRVSTNELPATDAQPTQIEQVVGIALIQEYTTNLPIKADKPRFFETWQRDEVEPLDNWKFYPKMDYNLGTNNISLLNLYDDAHYFIESDWLNIDFNLDFAAILSIELYRDSNETNLNQSSTRLSQLDSPTQITTIEQQSGETGTDSHIFHLKVATQLVDSSFNSIYSTNSTIEWPLDKETTYFNLGMSATEKITTARHGQLRRDNEDNLFKIIVKFVLDCNWITPKSPIEQFLTNSNNTSFRLSLVNVSLSDRCFPSPCQYGSCQQNGTGPEDWNCQCDDRHRGRRCEFGRWCSIQHVTPWVGTQLSSKNQPITLKTPSGLQAQQLTRQPKLAIESVTRVTGKDYCQRKLGTGSKCTDIDLPLNENLYTEEDRTFMCSCHDDFYLSDDSKCKQAHLCNSVLCPSIGMICDENKPFNKTQPCHCNEKQDWFPDPVDPTGKCVRRQCHDKQRDCQFDAHICLPTLPGEKPICKCGPKFTLKTNDKGQKYCQSTACVLPTLNDCQQICLPDNSNQQKPYSCACHPGYTLDNDGRTCKPQRANKPPHCRPACNNDTQFCTDFGCKCRQGYVGEGEIVVKQTPRDRQINNGSQINYVQSVKCLNVCSLTYAENEEEFEKIKSVCPLGLCDPNDFQCRCSDPSSSALVNTKYVPIYNETLASDDDGERKRSSPLCHLKRVCEPESSGYKICRSQGAICVPDYTKPAMFDCICPPSTEKKYYGQETSSEFTCEPKCSAKKYDCLRRQAVCKLVDKDQVRCDCLPGLMFDQHDHKCYLAKYSYSFNLVIVNRYYEPEAKYHRLQPINSTRIHNETNGPRLFDNADSISGDSDKSLVDDNETQLNEILPQYNRASTKPNLKSIFIADYNQCNITQVIPKAVIEDPYEHDIESFLGYIDQCNEKIHQNVRTYHLNSRLSEDLRQSLRQHLRDFTVTTSNSSCTETDSTGMYLNCTIYLQSNEPIIASTVNHVFNECDKHAYNQNYCWIKPRLLLKKQSSYLNESQQPVHNEQLNFRQVVPCEIDNFCGLDAYSVRTDDKTSLCSCKCPPDIEVVDIKDLEPRGHDEDPSSIAVKEICAPRNRCGANSTFCASKPGSVCQYDIRMGSRCNCVYPSYEDTDGKCVEVTYSQLDNTLVIVIIMLGTALIVSVSVNILAVTKTKSVFGRSKQYPLNEFTSTRPTSRSTGVPNPVFTND